MLFEFERCIENESRKMAQIVTDKGRSLNQKSALWVEVFQQR